MTSMVFAPGAVPIVTVGDLAEYQAGDPQAMIDWATATVRAYCGWHVTPVVTEELILDGSGSRTLMLPSLNVSDVSAVKVDDELVTNFAWSQVGYLTRQGFWPCDPRSVTVTLTHGYASVPDLAQVILSLASRTQTSPDGVVHAQVGQVSETYSQTGPNQAGGVVLLDSERAMLDRYRLPSRP